MLTRALAALLAAAPAAAADSARIEGLPGSTPLSVPAAPTAQDLVRAEDGLHPLAARDIDARLDPYLARLKALGLKAVPLLSWYAVRKDRPLKVRLRAAAALGLIGDPSALPALKDAAGDPKEDAGLRSAAVQALGSLRLLPYEKRSALDPLAAPGAPAPVLREALAQLAAVGTDRVAQTEAAARSFGPNPQGSAALAAGGAVDALGASPDSGADAALVGLVRFYRRGAPPRARCLRALSRRRAERRAFSPTRAQLDILLDALAQERGPAALSAARLLGLLADRRAVAPLIRLLRSAPEAAAAAEAAQALAALGDPAAAGPVAALAAGLNTDERFGAAKAGPDARALGSAVEAAARALAGPAMAPASREHSGGFAYEGWPGSGVPHPVAGERPLTLRKSPDEAAEPTASVKGAAAAPLTLTGSLLRTRRSGWARARAACVLEARVLGPGPRLSRTQVEGPAPSASLSLNSGELLEMLASRAEGRCFLRRSDTLYDASCPLFDAERFEVVSEPVAEWWLELDAPGGKGWASADDPALTILRD
ncbi:MAG: HEAT repeat domain-containing protein [Elusimicrobia bacterium]|nr:HEAT repeat domain-containing protein [Elusimicrobiota bacterium]